MFQRQDLEVLVRHPIAAFGVVEKIHAAVVSNQKVGASVEAFTVRVLVFYRIWTSGVQARELLLELREGHAPSRGFSI